MDDFHLSQTTLYTQGGEHPNNIKLTFRKSTDEQIIFISSE